MSNSVSDGTTVAKMSPDRIRDSVLFLTDIICESDQQTCLSLYSSLLLVQFSARHNYRADILDCNFHINVLYGKPTIISRSENELWVSHGKTFGSGRRRRQLHH